MKKVALFLQLIISILLCCGLATGVQAKDINLGWSGQESWTTLPYFVVKEKGFFDREGLKV